MPETENIAIAVLIACVSGLCFAIKIMWDDNKLLRTEAKQALLDGIDIEQARTAEITSISLVVSSVQRAVKAVHDVVTAGFERNERIQSQIYDKVSK